MKRYGSLLIGALTGAAIMAQGGYSNAEESIRCIREPKEYPLYKHQECGGQSDNHAGPYTS